VSVQWYARRASGRRWRILLERESVLAQLCVLGQRAGRGAGQVVLLRGEAGVGKTAVIRHFIAGLDERVRVLRGSCDPLATPRPLGPLIDMLAQLPGPQAGGLAEICVGSHTCCGHWVAPPRPPPAAQASLRLLEDCGPCPQLAWSLVNLAQLATAALRAVNVEDAAPCHHRHDVRSGRISGTAGSQSRCAAWIRALTFGPRQ
jgi:predicted ATPase